MATSNLLVYVLPEILMTWLTLQLERNDAGRAGESALHNYRQYVTADNQGPFPLVRTESTNVLYSSEPDHPHHRPSEAGASTSTIMRRGWTFDTRSRLLLGPLDHARSPSIYDYEYAPKMFDSRF